MSEETVLVVDDEEAIAEAVRARLESEGFRVLVAFDGPQAIDLHREHHPDLVVLDLMLPGMDGLEVCKEIQRTSWTMGPSEPAARMRSIRRRIAFTRAVSSRRLNGFVR